MTELMLLPVFIWVRDGSVTEAGSLPKGYLSFGQKMI